MSSARSEARAGDIVFPTNEKPNWSLIAVVAGLVVVALVWFTTQKK